MSAIPTPNHPRWYRKRISTFWWLESWPFVKFVLREISSVFVAWFVILMLLSVRAVQQGPAAYASLLEWLRHPLLILLNTVSLFFVVFHTVTWFNLSPQAMPIRIRGKRVPDAWIAAPNYAPWVVVSLAVTWLMLRG